MSISKTEQIVDDDHPLILNGVAKTWLDIKIESIYLPSESYILLKEYIIKNCKKNNDCNSNIDSWDRKFDSIDFN